MEVPRAHSYKCNPARTQHAWFGRVASCSKIRERQLRTLVNTHFVSQGVLFWLIKEPRGSRYQNIKDSGPKSYNNRGL